MVNLMFILACKSEQVEFSNVELMTRLSIDLRGTRPTIEELDASLKAGWSIEDTVANLQQDNQFGRVSAERWSEIFDTRQDETLFSADELGLDDEFGFAYSVGDEPLRIIEEVIRRNLPWTDVLTADWTVLNKPLFDVYPAEWVGDASGAEDDWQLARYTDGRPAGGLLVSNGLWWRYDTSLNNASRKRANQLSKILLCRDYLKIPVTFDSSIDLTSEAALQDAINNHPGCVSCHATLDPLAAFLGGVFARRKSDPLEMIYYHPEREDLSSIHLGVTPSWNGQEGQNLGDLGYIFTTDPNFSYCTVKRFSESLMGFELGDGEFDMLLSDFKEHNNVGKLIRDIVLLDSYKLSQREGESALKRVSSTQLESMVESITGYTLYSEGYNLLRADSLGYSSMIQGDSISLPLILLQQELAHVASRYWFLESDKAPFDASTLKDLDDKVDILHRTILGISATNQEMQDLEQYIELLEPLYSTREVWASVSTVLMQDPRFLVY